VYSIFKDFVSDITVKKTQPFRKPRIISSRYDGYRNITALHHKHKATDWTLRCSNPGKANRPDRFGGPPSRLFNEYRRSFPRLTRPGREVFHSSPSSYEIKNEWNYTSSPPLCLHGVDRENFTVTFFNNSHVRQWHGTVETCWVFMYKHFKVFSQNCNKICDSCVPGVTINVM